MAGGPGCCWAVCAEGGSRPPAAAGGTFSAVSQGAAVRQPGPEGLGPTAGSVGTEAGAGGGCGGK